MATLCKLNDLSIRIHFCETLGARLHAIQGDTELVVSLRPPRILQGEADPELRRRVLDWANAHQQEVLADWRRYSARRRHATGGVLAA